MGFGEDIGEIVPWEPEHGSAAAAATGAIAVRPLIIDTRDQNLALTLGALLCDHPDFDTAFDTGLKLYGYLYAIEFDAGWTKVGYTAQPSVRLLAHVKNYRKHFQFEITRLWLSIPRVMPTRNEDTMLRLARALSDGRTLTTGLPAELGVTEVFSSVDFELLIAQVSSLPYRPVTAEHIAADLERKRRRQQKRKRLKDVGTGHPRCGEALS